MLDITALEIRKMMLDLGDIAVVLVQNKRQIVDVYVDLQAQGPKLLRFGKEGVAEMHSQVSQDFIEAGSFSQRVRLHDANQASQ